MHGFNSNQFVTPNPKVLSPLIFSSGDNVPSGDSFAIFGRSDYEPVESDVDFVIPSEKVFINELQLSVGNNGSNGFSVSLHKNGIDLPETLLTVPAGSTGNFSTGSLQDQFYVAGDILSIHFNKIGGGSISNITMFIEVQIL